jgi:hypothetical protein
MSNERADRRTISLGFTDKHVLEGQHICYLYNDDVERRRVVAKYLESGLLAQEKLLYLVDEMTPEEMLDCLEELGVEARSKPAELTVAEAASVYCPRGVFNADEMLDTVRDFYVQAVEREGYAGARGTGEMSWCLVEGRADEASLMEYEARLNLLVAEYPHTVCCQYDARRFDGNIILDVLAVHPVMIVRGQLVKNPYYVDPEEFLIEYRERAVVRQPI